MYDQVIDLRRENFQRANQLRTQVQAGKVKSSLMGENLVCFRVNSAPMASKQEGNKTMRVLD